MMTRETDVLANVVMNAFWFPERYKPTDEHPEELNPGKLAREYVIPYLVYLINIRMDVLTCCSHSSG